MAVVVTRYFGGTLLGTGGLVRAYSGAVRAGLDASVLITRLRGIRLLIGTDYTGLGKIQYLLGQRGIRTLESRYTDAVELSVSGSGRRDRGTEAGNHRSYQRRGKNWRRKEKCVFAMVDGEPVILEGK